jgi:hypothetical protein
VLVGRGRRAVAGDADDGERRAARRTRYRGSVMSATADPIGDLSTKAIASLLEASAAAVVAELGALGGEGGWRPEPGEWSANECVGHLIEAERRGFAGRIRAIVAAPPDRAAVLETWDPPAVAAARHDDARDAAALADEFAALRVESVALVRALTPADLERVGQHPHVGPLLVGELIAEWVHHDRNHLRQMLAVSQARVWDQMGNARRFSLEDL